MKRRVFVQQSLAGTAAAGLAGLGLGACSVRRKKQLTVLHTNDVHSHIDPFPRDHSQYPGMGGMARRAALIAAIRKENPHTLLFDAGDIFQGTPYFNFYGGELEFRLMSMLAYDAATVGNHDFDNGVEGLLAQMPHAGFSMLSANYDFRNTVLDGYIDPYRVYLADGIKIGVFGLGIALRGLVSPSLYKETRYLDPLEVARDTSRTLREDQGCDLIICLSHLGHEYRNDPNKPSDLLLASGTENIDLIIGGHTHTFLDRPVIRMNRAGKRVLVNQVGCYGVNLGRIDFYFDRADRVEAEGMSITV